MSDEEAIRALISTWISATKTGDSETVLSLMTDDVVFMTPRTEPFGKKAFEIASEEQEEMKIEGTAEPKEIEIYNDIAYARTYITIAMTDPDGEKINKSGYTLTLFKKGDDGAWRLYRDANLVV